jgi:hypothetical protein
LKRWKISKQKKNRLTKLIQTKTKEGREKVRIDLDMQKKINTNKSKGNFG